MSKQSPAKKIHLEPLTQEHIDAYCAAFTPKVQEMLEVGSWDSERAYLEGRIAQKTQFFYVIKDSESDAVIGAIEIRDPGHRSQLYCWLNESWWGSGLFQRAMHMAAEEYFSKTGESTITARVELENIRSVRALEKAGFTLEGTAPGPAGKQYVLVLKRDDSTFSF